MRNATIRWGLLVLLMHASPVAFAQPQTLGETWNVKGYANNAVERITVQVSP